MEVGKTDEELLVESKQEKVGQETFQQQSNKLGFSIAQIMGFYGKKPQPNTDEERPISRSIKFSLLFVTLNFLPFSSFESTHSGCKSCNSTARFPNPQHFSLVGGFKPSVISGKKANGKWGG